MDNRIKSFVNQEIANSFSSYSLSSRLKLFEGPQEIETLIANHIKEREEKAKREGYQAAMEEMRTEARRQIDQYIFLVTKIVDIVRDVARKKFNENELKILEARTNFHLDSFHINTLFVIKASLEKEFEFTQILNSIKSFVLQEDQFVAELFYVNTKDNELDHCSIDNDYPFVRATSQWVPMPSEQNHIDQAKHNISFLESFYPNYKFNDWSITVAFYTCIHIVEAVIHKKEKDYLFAKRNCHWTF